MKYPGGYQIIDLKGIVVTSSRQEITDPEIREIIIGLWNNTSNKPIYISNFSINGDPVQPLAMIDELSANDTMYGVMATNKVEISCDGKEVSIIYRKNE